jgi:hypothetical protein
MRLLEPKHPRQKLTALVSLDHVWSSQSGDQRSDRSDEAIRSTKTAGGVPDRDGDSSKNASLECRLCSSP